MFDLSTIVLMAGGAITLLILFGGPLVRTLKGSAVSWQLRRASVVPEEAGRSRGAQVSPNVQLLLHIIAMRDNATEMECEDTAKKLDLAAKTYLSEITL